MAHFQLVFGKSEMLYFKFQSGLEVGWLGINPAGVRFVVIVAVYVEDKTYL